MHYFFSVFIGTFVLEDVALALALGLVADERLMLVPAFLACFLGISIGDIVLYLLGRFAGSIGLEEKFKSLKRFRAALVKEGKSDLLTYSVVISRFIPGTRLPTYLVAGLLRYPIARFIALTVVTVFGWVALAFLVGRSLKSVLMNHWILTAASILIFLRIVKFLVAKLSDPWERKALLHSWRKYLSFEFWPATIFYLPIVPYYLFLAIKHRIPLAPFYANPETENGGLLGESKWDFLRHLNPSSGHALRSFRLTKGVDFVAALKALEQEEFAYPFILKPDVGQRGFGVRIIRDDFDLTEYLLLADFDMIAQELSALPREAGIFYIRHPDSPKGFIFSITDKIFPVVTGDGSTTLGNLILRDQRARIIASTYFARHRDSLSRRPDRGEIVVLSECGNHCQGAIFKNGIGLKTADLEAAIEKVAAQIPHFYFGRFDIRYKDHHSLMRGLEFEIVEVNGAGSEATHIWDTNTRLLDAYRTLFEQWRLLFEVGALVKRDSNGRSKVHFGRFLKECQRVFFRKETLSISS